MLPVPLAFAWFLWRQHRWAFLGNVAYLVLSAAVAAVLPSYCSPIWAGNWAAMSFIGIFMQLLFVMVVFAHGSNVHDVFARESCFPRPLLRLPLHTFALAVWPIAAGAVVIAVLVVVTAWFILMPWLKVVQDRNEWVWWPALLATAELAWLQALVWSPFGLRWLRILILMPVCIGLIIVGTVIMVNTDQSRTPDGILASIYAVFTVAGWVVAYFGLRRGRCGDVPDWGAILQPLRQIGRWWPQRRNRLPSAARAQEWFEWRLVGLTLPVSTGLTVFVVLIPLRFGDNDVLPVGQTLVSALLLPVFLAGIFGAQGGGNNPGLPRRIGLGAFSATLPMTTADMVAAMLKVATRSTLIAWGVVIVMLFSAVLLTRNLTDVAAGWRQALDEYHPLRIAVGVGASGAFLLVWTWKRLVDKLYFGLTGRLWVANTVACVCFPGSIGLCFLAAWIYRHPETHAVALSVLPWLVSPLLVCRALAAIWALRAVVQKKLVMPNTIARWLAAWLLLASVLFGLLAWSVPNEVVPTFYVAAAVLFAMPMVRLAAAPLALAWNRHR